MSIEQGSSFNPEEGESKPSWEELVVAKNAAQEGRDIKEVEMEIMTELFEERKGQFSSEDLTQDSDGSWKTFEDKVRRVFPEIPDRYFKAIKAAVSMELCGQ